MQAYDGELVGDLPIVGWIPVWTEDGYFVSTLGYYADREHAENEACGAAVMGSPHTLVIPAYSWRMLHPLLDYRRGR